MNSQINIPQQFLYLMNQLFEIEKKSNRLTESHTMGRNISRMKDKFSELGLEMHDPLGEAWNETRTDCEANIAGSSADNLVITEVIKPIIRLRQGGAAIIVQKGVVIAEAN